MYRAGPRVSRVWEVTQICDDRVDFGQSHELWWPISMASQKPLRPFFTRNLDAGQLLETFLVSAVAAFLGVRFFLGVTGYPRLGGGGLHISHMLWGGALMVAAVLLLLGYLGERIRRAAAVLAGIGFGLFID